MRQHRYQLRHYYHVSVSSTFNVAYIKIPASMIITIIITLTRIGAIACTRNTIIDTMSIRVITAIIMAPITLSVTLPNPLGFPN